MRVIKWEPFRDVDDVFDRFIAESLRHWPRPAQAARAEQDWTPPADVSETEAEYVIRADLPEVRKEDVSVTVQDGVLTLSGERRPEPREESEKMHRLERPNGRFARRFALPENVDEQAIRAESREGVLRIRIPKQKVVQPEPRQIEIH